MATRFKWNLKGFAEVRNAPKVVDMIDAEASRRASTSGPGYETRGPERSRGRGRARAAVLALGEARRAEATSHNLARP